MPTYEYRCGACGHEFERFHGINADPIRVCPSCEEEAVERLISTGGGIVFKGPGFYATDYRKGGPSGSASTGGGSSESGSKDSSSSKDSSKSADTAKDGGS